MRQRSEGIVTEKIIQDEKKPIDDSMYLTKLKSDEEDPNNNPGKLKDDDICEKSIITYGTDYNYKQIIVWKNAIFFLILHLFALYGAYLCFTKAKTYTTLWGIFLTITATESITVGTHRMWAHKAMKAKFILRLVLLILQTVAGQNCLWVWVRDHRQHHRYSDTDADPHNATRGFFFSHIGWLMTKKHPLALKLGKSIDMSDIEADKIIMIQKKYYKTLYFTFAVAIPVLIPIYMWNESFWTSFFVSYAMRYVIGLNFTWTINSFAHLYGTKPYDKNILPVDSLLLAMFTNGEAWHNYHHVFPWDYKAAEFGTPYQATTKIIDALASIGLIYDLKEASPKLVEDRLTRTGDGTFRAKFK